MSPLRLVIDEERKVDPEVELEEGIEVLTRLSTNPLLKPQVARIVARTRDVVELAKPFRLPPPPNLGA